MAETSAQQPVFIHGLWRSHSTFIWQLFRNQPENMAFYEPLHHNLATRTQEQCEASHTSKPKDLIFRHPKTHDHYFREFPLRATGGVAGFDTSFCADEFVKAPNSPDTPISSKLSAYLNGLKDQARQASKRPVFKENRSWLRAGWLKQKQGGTHIYLDRPHDEIYRSALRFVEAPHGDSKPENFFVTSFVMVMGRNAHHPLYRPAATALGIPHIPGDYDNAFAQYAKFTEKLPRQKLYDVIAFHAATGRAHARQYADVIIDTARAMDPIYQKQIKTELTRHGIGIALETFNPPPPLAPSGMQVSPTMRALITTAEQAIATGFAPAQPLLPDTRAALPTAAIKPPN